MRSLVKIVFSICLMLGILSSCKVDKIIPTDEKVKDISGSWKVQKVVRNGVDISSYNGLDVSAFRIEFQGGSYTLKERIPFLVKNNGTFSFDDPQYPLSVTFTPNGGSPVTTTLNYPIQNGVRTMIFEFIASAPDCSINKYAYTLVKE